MARMSFALPDLGEGLTEGEILRWLVAAGDEVRVNQPLVEVETAKAAVEVPSPYAGTVARLHAAEGDTVDVGAVLVEFDVAGEDAESSAAVDEAPKGGVLVGYGPREGGGRRRRRISESTTPAAPPAPPAPPTGPPPGPRRVLAKPPVRKYAKDLGVDLGALAGSGPDGRVTRADVQAAADGGAAAPVAAPRAGEREERVPVRSVRKATAAAVTQSAFSAPHVTEFLTVDVTASMELLPRLRALPDFADVPVSPLLLVARALLAAVRRHPMINSTWHGDEIVVHHYVHLGIAAATGRGLIVPSIKDADALSLPELARALAELVATAREGRATPADLTGGTITITNVGVFGVDSGTPILTPGQAAILCLGAIGPRPWVVDGELAVRQVTQLALSFDHRIVDGELGSRVLADVGRALSDPAALLAWS